MTFATEGRVALGAGVVAEFVWQEKADRETGIPCGSILRHDSCALYVAWVDDGWLYADGVRPLWSLVSLAPLTIVPGVDCPTCGRVGAVSEGRWIDVSESEVDRS